MKGYALSLLIVAIVLLLLPLPALPRAQAAVTTPAPAQPSAAPTTTPSTTAPSQKPTEETVKILVGDTVVSLSCRDFLIRTLAFEMSPDYHPEALKAQAVAAYTYYGRRQRAQAAKPDPTLKGAHFKAPDSTFPQEYTPEKLRARWGDKYDTYYAKLCAAADAVTGQYMVYGEEWIDACYFAISHGTTESAEAVWGADVPYLRSVASPGDKLASGYEKAVTLTPETVKAALLKADSTLVLGDDPAAWFGKPAITATGSVATLAVGGKDLRGTAVRAALSLRSTHFTVTFADGQFTFTTRGYGHGVGMSQYGADYLARQGYTWQEILRYYYTGITIVE